jgi:hypothetical protein
MEYKLKTTYKHKNGALIHVLEEGTNPAVDAWVSQLSADFRLHPLEAPGWSAEELKEWKRRTTDTLMQLEAAKSNGKGQWLRVRFPSGNIETIHVSELED